MGRARGAARQADSVLPFFTWLAVVASVLFASPGKAQSASDQLKRARDAFDYGDFSATSKVLDHLDIDAIAQESDRVEAYRLQGLSHYYLGKPTPVEAQQASRIAFFNLLKEDPDYQLDPLFVPPDAIAFFDAVRRDQEAALAPVRKYRRARMEEQQREQQARREASMVVPNGGASKAGIDKRFALSNPVVALLPFGLGQFQNGNNGLGTMFAATEGVAALTSVVSLFAIQLFVPTGYGSGPDLQTAQDFNVAKWVSAGIFYALWIAGVAEAIANYVPQRPLPDLLPSAAPAGPLPPPTRSVEPPATVPKPASPTPAAVAPMPSALAAPSTPPAVVPPPPSKAMPASSTQGTP